MVDDPTIREIDEKTGTDLAEERMRRDRFAGKYPGISKIPAIGPFAAWCSSIGVVAFAGIFISLVLSTAIKAPYFDLPFTGGHAMKYNTYVEPALHMAEKDDVTWYQLRYQADPITNGQGIFDRFGHLPLYEWGLFATFKLLPAVKIENNVRLFAHAIGILILITSFFFFRRWIPRNLALLVVFLMAINPVISFSTYVTVLDSLLVLLTFVSLIWLAEYNDTRKLSRLFLAGIVFGIGNSVKYSMFLWVVPIACVLLYLRRESTVLFLRDFLVYCFLGVVCILANHTSLSTLPRAPGFSMIMFFLWVSAFILMYFALKKYHSGLEKVLDRICKSKALFLVSALGLIVAGIVVVERTWLGSYVDDFLTDSSLMFNPRVYLHMFRIQFKSYATPDVFWLAIAGAGIVFMTRGGELKKITIAILSGSVVYWIVAIKAMFIHEYYTIIIMVAFSLLAAVTIYYLLWNIRSIAVKTIVCLLFMALIFPRALESHAKKLGQNEDISGVVRFIMNHTEESDLILNESLLCPISIYTGRSMIFPFRLRDPAVRDEIQRIGFADTMRKYNIKYLFRQKDRPLFTNFAPIFDGNTMVNPNFDRKAYIYNEMGKKDPEVERNFQELQEVVRKYRIEEKFKLEAEIGKFEIYSFLN